MFVLICIVVVLYCFVLCGYVCVCVYVGFVMCGCFSNMYTTTLTEFFHAFPSVVGQMPG
jgi:hypothetical protein